MGIFFVSHQPVVPEVNSAIRTALLTDPATLGNVEQEAAQRMSKELLTTRRDF